MHRAVLGPAVALALLAHAASGARAEEMPALTGEDWQLLPINRLEQQELARDHPDLVRRLTTLGQRVRRLDGLRAGRDDPDDEAGRTIAEQAAALRTRMAPLIRQALDALDDDVIDARLLARIRDAPRGPQRIARHAAGLPLFVEGLPEAVRALLAHVLPRMEGALLALEGRKRTLRAQGVDGGLEQAQVDRLVGGIDQRIRRMEKRYWRLVDYVVPEAARVQIHRRVPTSYQQHETVLEHLYALPGLTASQGTRLRAVLEEVQAQAAPDNALVTRLRRALGEQPDRRAAEEAIRAATNRIVDLHRWASDEAKTILTEAQWASFEAIPPRVSIQDRRATSVDLLRGVSLDRRQAARLKAMRAELRDVRAAYRERRAAAAASMQGMGPDSPQMAGATMAMAAVEADANVEQRRFNGRVLLELLTPDQVAAWVIAPPSRGR